MALAFLPGALSAQTLPDYLPAEGLVAWYPFNGNANDESGNGNHGVITGANGGMDRFGGPGSSFVFDGVNDFVSVPLSLSSPSGVSFSVWVQTHAPDLNLDHRGIVWSRLSGPQGSGIYPPNLTTGVMTFPNSVMFNSNDGSNSMSLVHPTAVLNDSNWHHLICTYEIGVGLMRLYLDGQLTNQHESSDLQSILILEGTLFIGKDEILGYGNRHWQGHIDDIGIWNRALTEAEVSALFSGTPPLFGCTDPSACNFNPEATSDDGSCVPSGCMDAAACNYDAMAGCDDGSCAPAGAVPGCMEAAACNYDAAAVCPGPCVYPAAGGSDCATGGALCGAGTVWDVASQTCIADPTLLAEATASAVAEALDGVCGEGTVWHPTLGVCVPWQSCPDWPYNPDSDADGSITVIDLLALLAIFSDVDSDGDGLFDSVDDCDGVYDACGVCGGVGLDADADGVCDDVDPCVGALDACGVCNGPGPNVAVLDQIIYATDSLLVPQLGVWYVYEYPIDTLYTYECPQPECSTTSLDTYNVGAPLASFYLDYTGPSSYNAGPRPAGAYALQVSGTFCGGSCWDGHNADAAFGLYSAIRTFTINEYCPQGNTSCEELRPSPDVYNPDHVYFFYFDHPGGEMMVYGFADECCWWDNQGGLSFQLFECTGN